MNELINCPFCGKELFKCTGSHYEPCIRHSFTRGCPLSDRMWDDTPENVSMLNRRDRPTNTRFADCHIWELGDKLNTIADECDVLIKAADIKALIAQPTNESNLDDRDGLKIKYNVTKVSDGSTVYDCFVLRPDRDPAAVTALQAYAAATGSKALADDIYRWVGQPANEPLTLEQLRRRVGKPVYTESLGWGIIGTSTEYPNRFAIGFIPGWARLENVFLAGPIYAHKPGGDPDGN